MKDKCERGKHYDYIWKVLLPEFLIKLYIDLFHLNKVEAEIKMRETPMWNPEEFAYLDSDENRKS